MIFEKLQGLIAAPFTPMDSNGAINLNIIPDYYSFLKHNKVTGAFILRINRRRSFNVDR
ncbi:hypothetical protein [Pedobacter steynii]